MVCSTVRAEESRFVETEHEEEERRPELEDEQEKEETEEAQTFLKSLLEKTTLSGFIELDYDYADVSDVADKDSGSTADLNLDEIELALEVNRNEGVTGEMAVTAEDVGADDHKRALDEVTLTIECPWIPLYFAGGKTSLRLTDFEDRLVSDTLIEELYEIDIVGYALGFAPDAYGLDLSITVYEGDNVIDNLADFGTHEFRPEREEEDRSSFIANGVLEPIEEMLTLCFFYDSEPGDGNRNDSVGGALTLDIWKFSLDAGYITAQGREDGEDGEENKESVSVVGLAFQPFESTPLAFAVRYEDFDDDRRGDQDEVLDYLYLGGFKYSFLKWATLFFEYRYLGYEKERGSHAADEVNELHLRLGLEF
jgi:hypothetical protein